MSEWMRLKRGNDWGVEYYYRPDRPKTPAGTYGKESGVAFKEGERLRVRWPDSSESTEVVSLRREHATVSDMGHSYPVSFELPGFKVSMNGVLKWFALDEVDLWQPSLNEGGDT